MANMELAMTGLVDSINDYLDENHRELPYCKVNGPQRFSARKRNNDQNGQYITKSFTGGEEFQIYTAYVGARGDVIFRLKPRLPMEIRDVDIIWKDGQPPDERMVGFAQRVEEILTAIEDRTLEFKEAMVKRLEERKADPDFGSW